MVINISLCMNGFFHAKHVFEINVFCHLEHFRIKQALNIFKQKLDSNYVMKMKGYSRDEDDSLGCCGCILMGLFFIFPCTDEFKKVDMRTIAFDVPPQEILTKDSVTVSVDAVVYAKVFDAVSSVCNVEDAFSSTKLLAATTLRNILGTKMMSEVLTERDNITEQIQIKY
ncbi:hypothetical protein KUTeg_021865 [Tegillarca granosa]|uniref:Band 7 domain-containing protein n=1 Tax=Tegillarca granosa TaxID=220873 RepID=A0ABQ9E7I0_TEGGR|nr:hypothetical protein KUTeg_021865 [Tegillarca granosa]